MPADRAGSKHPLPASPLLRRPLLRRLLLCALLLPALPAMLRAETRGACQEPVAEDFLEAAPDAALAGALLQVSAKLDADTYDIGSLLVLRDCRLVFERYNHRISREYNHTIYSATKSVVSTLVGALLLKGRLRGIDEPIADLLPRPAGLSDERWAANGKLTLRNVMQMASGLEYQHATGVGMNPIYQTSIDRLEVALSPKTLAPPGTRYNYSDGDASVTGAVVAAAHGRDLYATARELLLDPLQMKGHDWMFRDAAGRYPGGWGLRLRPMDMAKLGQLYLQDCRWNGRQICDPAYVKAALSPGVAPHYGLHWWLGRSDGGVGYFYANGVKGQRLFVIPSHGIVAAMTATLPAQETRAVEILILAALATLPAEAGGEADAATLAQLASLQKTGFRGRSRASGIQDQDYPKRVR